MDDIWIFCFYFSIDLNERPEIQDRDFAAHLGNVYWGDRVFLCKVAHIVLTGRDGPGYELGLKFIILQSLGQPNNVPRRAADVEPGNNSQDLHCCWIV